MVKGLYESANSLYFKQKNLEVVANNLANINTTGYKKELGFAELMSRFDKDDVKQTHYTDYSTGSITKTNNPLDFAIDGNAYLMVQTADGVEMTKNGKLKLDQDGYLVNDQGFRVLGNSGEINLGRSFEGKAKEFEVSQKGEIKINNDIIEITVKDYPLEIHVNKFEHLTGILMAYAVLIAENIESALSN